MFPERKHVAVVNNDLDARRNARWYLQEARYCVRLYDNSQDALQLINKPADLAVLDGYIPPFGGVELFKRLRAAHCMPVIFMSGDIGTIEEQLRSKMLRPEKYISVRDLHHLATHVHDLIGQPFKIVT